MFTRDAHFVATAKPSVNQLISILLQVVINFQTEPHYYFTLHSSYEVDKGVDISVDQCRLVCIGIG